MAHVYVRSGAAGAGTGADWTNAYTTLAAALTAKSAGDNFWISDDHAESQASSMTLTSPGTVASPCTVICVNRAGTVPPVSADLRTSATITTTGNSNITFGRTAYYYGIRFNCGTGAVATEIIIGDGVGAHATHFTSCSLRKVGTSGTTQAIHLVQWQHVVFDNTTVDFGSTADAITLESAPVLIWRNTSAPIVTTFPSIMFYNFGGPQMTFVGVDFSAAGFSGKTLFGSNNTLWTADVLLTNCKLHSSLTVSQTPRCYDSGNVYQIQSDSAGTNYQQYKISYSGGSYVETTTVRTGTLATDGTTPISWAIVTESPSSWLLPFVSMPIAKKNTVTGANVTVTVYGVWNGGAVPNNDDIWIEVSYMGVSSSPIATINTANTKADYLAANAAQASDSSTWGGNATTKFKMSVTLSSPQPALTGPIYVTVKAAKPSTTFYIDPGVVLS